MRVAFDVGEAGGKGRQDVERAFLFVLCAEALGNRGCFLEGAGDKSNGLQDEP
jgi:hypothetical protein